MTRWQVAWRAVRVSVCAGDYVASEFRRLGLKPAGDAGTFFQDVPLASVLNPHAAGGTGRNVIAALEGADAGRRGEWVVVGAHYDHLGEGRLAVIACTWGPRDSQRR
jgi:hypothetical protein